MEIVSRYSAIFMIPALLIIALLPPSSRAVSLVFKKVDRTVDASSQIVKIVSKITVENTGEGRINELQYWLDPLLSNNLAFIVANKPGGGEDRQLTVKSLDRQGQRWNIELPQPLERGRSAQIEVETAYSRALDPFPSQITQADKQLVRLRASAYEYSPYPVTSQTTTVTLATANIENYSKTPKPVAQKDTAITYGPYDNILPEQTEEILIHYENNAPFLAVTSLLRTIEVSHWGNIAVEETIDIRHVGATLKGPFSRYEYQREQTGVASVKSFKTYLPASASDVYYRDEIGNISTSHLRPSDDTTELDLRPRFPLFGGWKTHYVIGYNLPSYEYLYYQGDRYVLKMRFIDHIFDDMLVDEATVKVILPEGSRDIDLQAPYAVQKLPNEVYYSYLDTVGRPVIVASKKNLVENHIQDFTVAYTYKRYLMLQEPMLVVAAFFLLYLLAIIYVRLDFSISKDEASEGKLRIAGFCDQAHALQDKLLSLYQHTDTALQSYKQNKDNAAYQAATKKINEKIRNELQTLGEIHGKLKHEVSDATEKVGELLKLHRQLREDVKTHCSLVEKLVAGRMPKQQFLEQEGQYQRRHDDFIEKTEQIVTSL